jgi:uncharacterized protein YeaC (DUF1315 family)
MMLTPEQKEKRFSLFMDSGIMDNKNWKKEEVKHWMKQCIKLWEKMQEGMTHTRSPVTYVELKNEKVGRWKDVVEATQEEGNVNMFTVIQSYENHHAIIDQHGEILGYRYRIKPELLKTLRETTAALPPAKVNAGN